MTWKRNEGMHTSAEQARKNILRHLFEHGETYALRYPGTRPSVLGYAAYPDYNFKAPQGAAFSVAKILRHMKEEGVVTWNERGWFLTRQGVDAAITVVEAS